MTLEDFPGVTATVHFTVTINPCKITAYEANGSSNEDSYIYIVNEPEATTFEYTFTQVNACGYPEAIEVTKEANFIVHNA